LTREIKEYLKKVPAMLCADGSWDSFRRMQDIFTRSDRAYGYKLIQGQHFDSVIVIGQPPVPLPGRLRVSGWGIRDPLGVFPWMAISPSGSSATAAASLITPRPIPGTFHRNSTPFLQVVWDHFPSCPSLWGPGPQAARGWRRAIFRPSGGKRFWLWAVPISLIFIL